MLQEFKIESNTSCTYISGSSDHLSLHYPLHITELSGPGVKVEDSVMVTTVWVGHHALLYSIGVKYNGC